MAKGLGGLAIALGLGLLGVVYAASASAATPAKKPKTGGGGSYPKPRPTNGDTPEYPEKVDKALIKGGEILAADGEGFSFEEIEAVWTIIHEYNQGNPDEQGVGTGGDSYTQGEEVELAKILSDREFNHTNLHNRFANSTDANALEIIATEFEAMWEPDFAKQARNKAKSLDAQRDQLHGQIRAAILAATTQGELIGPWQAAKDYGFSDLEYLAQGRSGQIG